MRFEITARNHKVLNRKLTTLEKRVRSIREGALRVYERFREIEQNQFTRQGAGPSGPWAPLHPRTLAKKERLGHDPRRLHATLKLRPSLTRRGTRNAIFRANRDGIFMGTRDPKAGYHQKGTKKIPARPPIDLFEQDKREMIDIFEEWLLEGVTR